MSDLCREDVVELSDLSIELDSLADRCAEGPWRSALARAADCACRIAFLLDRERGFGIYVEETPHE